MPTKHLAPFQNSWGTSLKGTSLKPGRLVKGSNTGVKTVWANATQALTIKTSKFAYKKIQQSLAVVCDWPESLQLDTYATESDFLVDTWDWGGDVTKEENDHTSDRILTGSAAEEQLGDQSDDDTSDDSRSTKDVSPTVAKSK